MLAAVIATLGLRAATLDDVLQRMDRGAKDFRSMTAKMNETDFDAVLNESDKSTGEVSMRKGRGGSITGKVVFSEPNPRTYFVKGHDAQVYYPKAKQVQIYDTGKLGPKQIDQILLMGFGTPVSEINKEYTIKLAGAESVNGVPATHIELTPKEASLKQYVAKVELWIPDGGTYPVREKVTAASNNYRLVDFSDVKANPVLPDSVFELNLPADVEKIYPQKVK